MSTAERLVGRGAAVSPLAFVEHGRTALQAAAAIGHMNIVEGYCSIGNSVMWESFD